MNIKKNPLVMLIEESIQLKQSAQVILSEAVGGATLTRLERLVLIAVTEETAPRTSSQLSRNLGHSRQVVQRVANRLVELGLVRKLQNPDHKTAPLLEPTEKGRKFERQMGGTIDDIVRTLLSESDLKLCKRISSDIKRLRGLIESYKP